MEIKVNAKGLTLNQLKHLRTLQRAQEDSIGLMIGCTTAFVYYNPAYGTFSPSKNWGHISKNMPNKAYLVKAFDKDTASKYALYKASRHDYKGVYEISPITIKSFINRNLVFPVLGYKINRDTRCTFCKRSSTQRQATILVYYMMVVNPKIQEWFMLDDNIGMFLDSDDPENWGLAKEILKGYGSAFNNYTIEADNLIDYEKLKENPKIADMWEAMKHRIFEEFAESSPESKSTGKLMPIISALGGFNYREVFENLYSEEDWQHFNALVKANIHEDYWNIF